MRLSIRSIRKRPRRPAAIGTVVALLALLACVDARAAADCTISTVGVAFGNYDPLDATSTDATGDLKVVCTHVSGGATRVSYVVALSAGSSGNYAQRRMRAGTTTLNYNLFDSATRTRIWGNGTGGTTRVTGSLLINPGGNRIREASHPIYGRIPALQAVATGNYSDTIVVTLTF
jgi:spore coat protein U-like protein